MAVLGRFVFLQTSSAQMRPAIPLTNPRVFAAIGDEEFWEFVQKRGAFGTSEPLVRQSSQMTDVAGIFDVILALRGAQCSNRRMGAQRPIRRSECGSVT